MNAVAVLASIPSPAVKVWYLGPLPLRAYGLAIIAGIAAAIWIGTRRLRSRTDGGGADDILDVAFWAVPFGIVGARLYHVVTSPDRFFGPGGDLAAALRVWEGGLGIWGGIAGGALGAYIACRRKGLRFAVVADAIAPGLLIAQAIGRLGNWFNQELFGSPTTLPWGLEIDAAHLPVDPATGVAYPLGTLFHPTFLYEILWNLAAFGLLVWLDRRLSLGHGRVMLAYVGLYTLGRGWIEMLRIDPAQHVLGLRLNVWVSLVLFTGAIIAFTATGRRLRRVGAPTREADVRVSPPALSRETVPAA